MDEFIHIALKNLVKTHNLKGDDLIVVLAGNYNAGSGFSFIDGRNRTVSEGQGKHKRRSIVGLIFAV